MLNEIIFTVVESLDGGYEAKAIGHSIYTQCDEQYELQETLREAVKCHFDEDKRIYHYQADGQPYQNVKKDR